MRKFKRAKIVLLKADDEMFSEGPSVFIPWKPKPKDLCKWSSIKPGEPLLKSGFFIPWRPKNKPAK